MRASVATAPRDLVESLPTSCQENESPNLSQADRNHLGERLRAMYAQLRDEPLSPHLQDLVLQLAQTSPE